MKPEEALKELRYPELPDGLVMVDLETRQEAIKALKKQSLRQTVEAEIKREILR